MNTLERHTLQEWRRLRNMTQLDLAYAMRQLDPRGIGLTPTTISDYETGQYMPSTENALLLVRALAGNAAEPLLLDQIIWPALMQEKPAPWRKSTASAADADNDESDPKAQAA